MQKTVLILGASGRFGRNAQCSFSWAGWNVRTYDRKTDQLPDAAWGADLIVNAWNPAYTDWARNVPKLTKQIIDTATDTGATVLIPGNVYNYGSDMPAVLSENTPHRAGNPLGQIRIEMEQAYKNAGVRTIVLRAGDYIDTIPSGNWFDKIITAKAAKGIITYPGDPDLKHSWAFMPDVTDMAATIAARMDELDTFTEYCMPGYALTGHELADAVSRVTGKAQWLKQMSWLPIKALRPFWSMATPLLEMSYLWNTPHELTSNTLTRDFPEFQFTSLDDALRASLPEDINPDGFVRCDVTRLPRRLIPFNCGCSNVQAG